MTDQIMNDHLEHHGIKGQKWGVRRYQNPDGTRTPEGKIRYSRANSQTGDAADVKKVIKSAANTAARGFETGAKETVRVLKKMERSRQKVEKEAYKARLDRHHRKASPLSQLTDEELRSRIARLKLENEYRNFTRAERTRGEKFVQDILAPTLKNAVTTYGQAAAVNVVNNAFTAKRMEALKGMTTEDIEKANKRLKAIETYKEHISPIKKNNNKKK